MEVIKRKEELSHELKGTVYKVQHHKFHYHHFLLFYPQLSLLYSFAATVKWTLGCSCGL